MSESLKSLRPTTARPQGRLVMLKLRSRILLDNPLGDPAEREHPVYLPAGYDDHPDRRYPLFCSLAAYTNAGPGQVAWRNHGETLPQRLDRLIDEQRLPPLIMVFPDCYTALGGNQYVNTPAMGRYADFLTEELIPAVDARFRTLATPDSRAVFGKSSGGFGALHLAMSHPGTFGAVASHAGDAGFDLVYRRDFTVACDVLARHDGNLEHFVRTFWRDRKPGGAAFHTLMTLCLAASYSPDATRPLGLALPFDLKYCRLDEAVWNRWLAFDPVQQAPACRDALAGLKGLWIDAGSRDQYFIHYGTRQLAQALSDGDVAHHFEEFDGTHSGIDWRYDHSLPWLAERLNLASAAAT